MAGVVHGGLYDDEGSFAEYLKVEVDLLFKVPKGMGMDEAATFGVAYVTAVQVCLPRPPCDGAVSFHRLWERPEGKG